MRFTRVVRQYAGTKENLVFKMKVLRERQGYIEEPFLHADDALFAAQAGIKIEDPNKLWQPEPRFPEWVPPKDWNYEPPVEELPHYQDNPCFSFDTNTTLLEGLKQVLILTKTQAFNTLPDSVLQKVGAVQIPYQNELAQRYIMYANLWDSTKERVKRHRLPETPKIWKFKAEDGVPEDKIIRTMLQNLTRMCDTLQTRYPSMQQRKLTRDHPVQACFTYQEGMPILISSEYPVMLSSETPLAPFADEATVLQSEEAELPDIFPISPMIDLKPTRLWRKENLNGWPGENNGVHLHTAFQQYTDYSPLNPRLADQRSTRALFMCFQLCLSKAKQLYGWDFASTLPEPISAQHVGLDAFGHMTFTCFQLNTLDVASAHGVKNLAWLDHGGNLYEKLIPKRAMLRNTKYQNFDSEVLEKFIALYTTGVDLSKERKVTFKAKQVVEKEEAKEESDAAKV